MHVRDLVGSEHLAGVDHGSLNYCWSSVEILQAADPVVPDEHSCWSNYSGRCPRGLVPLLDESASFDVETATPEYKVISKMLFTLSYLFPPPYNC